MGNKVPKLTLDEQIKANQRVINRSVRDLERERNALVRQVETYSRIVLPRSYGNLQSYWTTTKLCKLSDVLNYYEAKGAYSRI